MRLRTNDSEYPITVLGRVPLRLGVGAIAHDVVEIGGGAPSGAFRIVVDGVTHEGHRLVTPEHIWVRIEGRTFVFARGEGPGARGGAAKNEIRADMPGTIVAVHVAPGQHVTAGEPLVTLESMKLQITVASDRDAVVGSIPVSANTTFDRGAVLVVLAEAS